MPDPTDEDIVTAVRAIDAYVGPRAVGDVTIRSGSMFPDADPGDRAYSGEIATDVDDFTNALPTFAETVVDLGQQIGRRGGV